MTNKYPAVSYSVTIRAEYPNRPGMLGITTSAIGEVGGEISGVDIVRSSRGTIVRDLSVNARDIPHGQEVVAQVRAVP